MIDLRARDIMIKEVVTSKPTEIIASAKLIMSRQGIGGLPVVNGDELVGIITHRDVVLAGDNAMRLKIEDIMTRKVMAVKEDTSIKDVVMLMKRTGYQRIPVVRGKKLIGLITQSSIINAIADYL